ncbi:MAG: Rne/Rng family ribonuclease [Acidobacteria bacterium]|nr:Rne/Rng family ribonuclease [Acidobacteriota bacterium]
MRKELIVSASPHETKIAVLEDEQLVEVYFEREKEYKLAGSIYKGRVTRVLPGMQSAFVDIGLERDAFLYVSDFLEDVEEYDKLVSTVERKAASLEESPTVPTVSAPPPEPETHPEKSVAADSQEVIPQRDAGTTSEPARVQPPRSHPHPPSRRRSRRHRGHPREFPESKYARPSHTVSQAPVILPGESLAKYKDRIAETDPSETAPAEPALEIEAKAYAEGPGVFGADSAQAMGLAVEPSESDPELAAQPTAVEPSNQPEEVIAVPSGAAPSVTERPPAELSAALSEPEEREPVSAAEPRDEFDTARPSGPASVEPAAELPEQESPMVSEGPALESSAREETPATAESASESVQSDQPFEPTLAEPLATQSVGTQEPVASGNSGEEVRAQAKDVPAGQETSELGEVEPSSPGQQASVREGARNPRFLRRTRWMARRQAKPAQQSSRPQERETSKPTIADLLKEGQEIIVQIAKEPLGSKGARITSHIALPGRYLVYMPTLDHIGVSRKVASEEERQRLKRIILEHTRNLSGGFIVRTAGEGHSEEDFRQDIAYLASLWGEIKAKAEKVKVPAALHHDLNLVLRTLRDQVSEEYTVIWTDNEQEYAKVLDLVSKFQPSLLPRVKLYTKDVPIFEEMGIQEEINKALKTKVWLKSGGYIVINQTEALVAIDINTGKFVGKSNRLEDTIVKTNVDAIQEIVRQIRLRDLGGIIVIDFIDMDERKNRQKVMAALEEALKTDRAPSKILSINEFGLVAITRKRVRQSLERTLCQPCPDCSGSGFVKSVATISLEILAEARKLASQWEDKQVTLRVNPEVAKALKSRDSTVVQEIEQMSGKTVLIRTDPTLHMESFDFY